MPTASFTWRNNTNASLDDLEIEPVEAWIESISNTGLMEIRFSNPVIPFEDITAISHSDYFLELEQFSDEEDQAKSFSWELKLFHHQYTLTQLSFTSPLQISQGKILDQITVYMRKDLFLYPDL